MSVEVHQADIGTLFHATIKDETGAVVDISAATTKQLKFRKPDGVILTKTGVFATDGTDGGLTYTTIAGDLDLPGIWKVQAYAVVGGWTGHSDTYQFTVYRNLA